MAAGKFVLNRRTGRHILRDDGGVKDALDNVAEDVADKAGPTASIDHYKTDRMVAGVVVGRLEQARDGAATRAAQQTVAENAGRPFRSRAQWRYFAANRPSEFRARARKSAYSGLPERKAARRA